MSCFMGYNPLVAKEVKITTWIKEFDGDSPVYPSFPNDGDCFVVFATDEDALTHNALSKKTYNNGDWADAEGGGGGGGDFNTAEVTVKVSAEHEGSQFGLNIPEDVESPYYGFFGMFAMPDNTFSDRVYIEEDAITCTLYYAGDSIALEPNNAFESCTGNAVFDPDTYKVIVSGDCTVTGYVED